MGSRFTVWRASGKGVEVRRIYVWIAELDATTPEGNKIPPVCFIKGKSFLMVILQMRLREKSLISSLSSDPAIEHGYEQVAGMVDKGMDPDEVARIEVEEETGVTITTDQLVRLNTSFKPTGTSDESLYFYYVEIKAANGGITPADARRRPGTSISSRI